jgi:hypothetical protein
VHLDFAGVVTGEDLGDEEAVVHVPEGREKGYLRKSLTE